MKRSTLLKLMIIPALAFFVPLVPQQKPAEVLTGLGQSARCSRPGTHQVPHGLVRRVRNPNFRQFSGSVHPGQHRRIAPVGLHPVSRLLRDQRRGHYRAVMAKSETSDFPLNLPVPDLGQSVLNLATQHDR